MFEPLAHTDPAGVNAIRARVLGSVDPVMSSSGPAIGIRADWESQLRRLKELGTEMIAITLHGPAPIHDRLVSRPGASDLTRLAASRIRNAGLALAMNVMLNNATLEQFDAFTSEVVQMGVQELSFPIAVYLPHARLRAYERHRPTLERIEPHAERIAELETGSPERWRNPATMTEATYVAEALQNGRDTEWQYFDGRQSMDLAVLSNLDVTDGDINYPRRHYGNLRTDELGDIIERVNEADERGEYAGPTDPASFFAFPDDARSIPPVAEVAEAVGDSASTRIHTRPESIHLLWLDRYFASRRRL